MQYKIEKAGYEYLGFKLGQKVIYKGEETTIIGFDERKGMDFTIVIEFNDGSYDVKFDVCATTVLDTAYKNNPKYKWVMAWHITPIKEEKESPKMEKKMTKAELEGKFVRCTWIYQNRHYKVGELYQIKDKIIDDNKGNDKLFSWYNLVPEVFTVTMVNEILKIAYDTTVKFEYVGDHPQSPNKVKSDEIKPDKKSKVSEIKVPIKVDMLFDPPVIEETNEEVFIFSGRSTIYISKEFGVYGIATVNSKELSSYDREIGKAISYYRAFKSTDKK